MSRVGSLGRERVLDVGRVGAEATGKGENGRRWVGQWVAPGWESEEWEEREEGKSRRYQGCFV